MTSILMVCLGNICRSPLAHGILQSKLSVGSFHIDSAGTAAYHIGKKPDHRSIQVASNNGLDISKQSARQFKESDFDTFDYIFAMDQSNYSNILSHARNNTDANKVSLFLDSNDAIENKNVPDPYYGDLNDFKNVFNLIDETCNNIATRLNN